MTCSALWRIEDSLVGKGTIVEVFIGRHAIGRNCAQLTDEVIASLGGRLEIIPSISRLVIDRRSFLGRHMCEASRSEEKNYGPAEVSVALQELLRYS